ncbi:MAG: N-acetylmuramoyl-L-alanine amidase [Pseudomonadota bacterium]
MRAVFLVFIWLWGLVAPAFGSDLTALARVVPDETRVEQSLGRVTLTIGLSQGVPYRVYTLAEPNQLVLEFSEVNWAGLEASDLETRSAGPAHVGKLAPGWSGFVLELRGPFQIEESAVVTGDALARLTVTLKRTSQEEFAAASGLPSTSVAMLRSAPATASDDDDFVVVIDPGHGGVDPGAERGGVREAELMLMMARELRDGLRRAGGFDVHLTRDDDLFVSLPARATMARRLKADAFISLHADALESGYAEGATVYTLSKEATDAASALLAERHNRADMLGGVDLGGQEDEIAAILLDLARLETTPRSAALAGSVLDGLKGVGARLNSNPQRAADFAVLRSADVPSVLVEVGFLSSERDRIELQSPEKRGRIIDGLVQGIESWAESDEAERARMRQ